MKPSCNCTHEGDIARERHPALHQEHCAILKWWNAKPIAPGTTRELDLARELEQDATIAAVGGASRRSAYPVNDPPLCAACIADPDPRGGSACHTCREIRRARGSARPGSSVSIHCSRGAALITGYCPEVLLLDRRMTVQPSDEDDYQRLIPALDIAAVFLGWRLYESVWWCPACVVTKKLSCSRCLSRCPACSCMGGPRADAVLGEEQ